MRISGKGVFRIAGLFNSQDRRRQALAHDSRKKKNEYGNGEYDNQP
jgi:hypothetical protein